VGQFAFLQGEWAAVFESAARAETAVHADPRTACFYARGALELPVSSAKGLEFPLVFVAGLQAMPMRDESLEEAARLLYVGMTRATHRLVLSAHGDSPIVDRMRQALVDVARSFAQASA
jgi:superfamily I DNA/RNA helicase